ncbi:XRE family transcriptional regulator [Actinomadura rugatobispora]|uniref:XRE family transcriptional regulator n=1 Tax=Actinomadura rugatobispora TaxID=1994 RepID=A0ABW0ZY78_9ACTN|nr:hypothetical protein GCM10010200_051640 [Actinomadura rugatobispora]
MSSGHRWQDIKAEAHCCNPGLADPERQAQARAELDAHVAGHHRKELRKAIGKTQAEVAQILGASQSRVSQLENGDIEAMELETLRAYATALGRHVDITVSVGPTPSSSPEPRRLTATAATSPATAHGSAIVTQPLQSRASMPGNAAPNDCHGESHSKVLE